MANEGCVTFTLKSELASPTALFESLRHAVSENTKLEELVKTLRLDLSEKDRVITELGKELRHAQGEARRKEISLTEANEAHAKEVEVFRERQKHLERCINEHNKAVAALHQAVNEERDKRAELTADILRVAVKSGVPRIVEQFKNEDFE